MQRKRVRKPESINRLFGMNQRNDFSMFLKDTEERKMKKGSLCVVQQYVGEFGWLNQVLPSLSTD